MLTTALHTTCLQFQPATLENADALLTLINAAYLAENTWTSESAFLASHRVTLEALAALIHTPDACLLTAWDNTHLAGCVYVQCYPAYAYFGLFAVDPARQGQGFGDHLLSACEHWAVQHWQATTMRMQVIASRAELIAWYQRRGYTPTGETKPFHIGPIPKHTTCPADAMFSVFEKQLI
jgi:ribosomal protein S18 acetylase RimI-like enzyme